MQVIKIKITVKRRIDDVDYTSPIVIRVAVADANDPAVVIKAARAYIAKHLPRVKLESVENLGRDELEPQK